MRYLAILAIMSLTALPAKACQLALVLGIDVSHSIDANEYRTQVTGLAEALRDPVIAATLVDLEVALTVVQWSGSDQQDISIPWQRMLTKRHITRFENRIRGLSRPWDSSNTGVGAALQKMLDQFDQVRDCQRKVIDFSGDGVSNAGPLPIAARGRARLSKGHSRKIISRTTAAKLLKYIAFREATRVLELRGADQTGPQNSPHVLAREPRASVSPEVSR